MSTSAARIAANKANAQKSTGPRTPEGKARVSSNALKHGLRSDRNPLDLAQDTALPFEREEFNRTLAAFLDDLAPQGPIETRLVERLAQIDLRLNRAIRMETAHLEMQFGLMVKSMAGSINEDEQTQRAWITTLAFLKTPSATTLLAQYESRLSRDFARTLTQLRQAQKARMKEEAQNSRDQTQPAATSSIAMSEEHKRTDLRTMPTQGPVRKGRVANNTPTNPANQTQQPLNAPLTNAARS
jgi:hypothetical protein